MRERWGVMANVYRVNGYLTMSCTADIEASSEEEARAKAAELQCPSICNQCSDAGGDGETWQLNGFDDPPEDGVQEVVLIEKKRTKKASLLR